MVSCGFSFLLQSCTAGLLAVEIIPECTGLLVPPNPLLYYFNNKAKAAAGAAFFQVVQNSIFVIVVGHTVQRAGDRSFAVALIKN